MQYRLVSSRPASPLEKALVLSGQRRCIGAERALLATGAATVHGMAGLWCRLQSSAGQEALGTGRQTLQRPGSHAQEVQHGLSRLCRLPPHLQVARPSGPELQGHATAATVAAAPVGSYKGGGWAGKDGVRTCRAAGAVQPPKPACVALPGFQVGDWGLCSLGCRGCTSLASCSNAHAAVAGRGCRLSLWIKCGGESRQNGSSQEGI